MRRNWLVFPLFFVVYSSVTGCGRPAVNPTRDLSYPIRMTVFGGQTMIQVTTGSIACKDAARKSTLEGRACMCETGSLIYISFTDETTIIDCSAASKKADIY